ncbi:DEAD/DEAH box helicase [Alkalicoccobacillus gibsonii]|uniref:DEAD/DEAH box helicase n=1 Tax=Alkalicoccobacillus gibsonii TaxID=79881 RepID=UPI001933DCBE|nr:DEAD/DEAH box helicase [Alkalicoccobacillus gibsonii]MBM0067985.1 DEAD/DEAH box helicase [Alkalicoccobacillus gibsonii]
MSLFKKRIQNSKNRVSKNSTNPIDIFKTLIHQEGYDYLRDVQKEFLLKWYEYERSTKDVVGVLNTGAGKTLIGQLILLSKLNEGAGPALYLCPDNQLVEQTIEQANIHNIPVVSIIDNGPTQPAQFPLEFLNEEAILVTTFERLFTGKSIFGVEGSGHRTIQDIGAIVIDDAHSCIKKARKQSTIVFENDHSAYKEILELFRQDLEQQGKGLLVSIDNKEKSVSRMVPYWSWREKKIAVQSILDKLYSLNDASVKFNWGLIGDDLHEAQCFISGDKLEITPLKVPFEKIPSFNKAKHRYILSATFNNNSELITELGLSRESVENPIKIKNQGDAGERLIIAPKRYFPEITDQIMRPIIADYATNHNVVVIVPNTFKANEWKAFSPQIVDKYNINDAKAKLKNSKGNLMVFLNRYDGIDLAGDACTILVLDGIPKAQTVRERYLSIVKEGSSIVSAQTAQTIEQGLGRAVRSGSDHCAVFILDNSLMNFIGIKKNRVHFTESTRRQLDFGLELFNDVQPSNLDHALREIKEAVDMCLSRDSEWRQFHKELILAEDDQSELNPSDNTNMLAKAQTELAALKKYKFGDYEEAHRIVQELVNSNPTMIDNEKSWYLQVAAEIIDKVNHTKSTDLQVKARNLSSNVLKPKVFTYSKLTSSKGSQSSTLLKWLSNYTNGTDVKIAIDELFKNLIYSPEIKSNKFERDIYNIGKFLGFSSQRPEHETNDGPDNLWRLDNGHNIIIEAKNERQTDFISRADIEQLLHSIEWHKDKYGDEQRYYPLLFHRASRTNQDAHAPKNSLVISEQKLQMLKESLHELGTALSQRAPSSWSENEIHTLLADKKLTHDTLLSRYSNALK